MWMSVAARTSFHNGHRKRIGTGYVGTDARTERIVKPYRPLAINTNAGEMDATIRVGCAGWWWHGIFSDTIAGAIDGLADNKLADIAVKAFRPPDIALCVESEQVRRGVAPRLGQIFTDIARVQCTRRWRRKPSNLGDRAIVFGKPDGAGAGVRPHDTVRAAIGSRRRRLDKLLRRGRKLSNIAGIEFRKPEIPSFIKRQIIGCRAGRRHRPLIPRGIAIIGRKFANSIGGRLGEPDVATGVCRQEQRRRIAGWLGIVLQQRKILPVILRDCTGRLLSATGRLGVTTWFRDPGIIMRIKADAPRKR